MSQSIACPDIACGAQAEIIDQWTFPSTHGPVEHVKTRCERGHVFTPTVASLVRPTGQPRIRVAASAHRLRVVVGHGAAGVAGAHRRSGPGGGVHGGVPAGVHQLGVRPTQTMPAWLQPFAANQPVTVATNALRGLILGPGAVPPGRTVAGQVVLALLWAAAIIAVFAPLTVRSYRRTVS